MRCSNEIERDGAQNVLKYKIAIPGPAQKTHRPENLAVWI